MAYVNRAGGIIFAHRHAHLIEDECGAPEYFTAAPDWSASAAPRVAIELVVVDYLCVRDGADAVKISEIGMLAARKVFTIFRLTDRF